MTAPESKATPGMVDVLAAHEFRSGAWGMCATCSCDEWESRERFYEGLHAAHRAHVAAALSTAGFGDTAAARAEALTQAADEMDRFRQEVYGEHIFRRPTPDEYREINALLKRERQHQTDDIGADCFDRAIRVQADLLRARAERQARDE